MALSNAEKVRAYRERQKAKKGNPVSVKLTEAERETLRQALAQAGMSDNPLFERLS